MKKQLIIIMAVSAMSLATGLGTHFGVNANSGQSKVNNPDVNTQAVQNLKNDTGDVSYEFDVLNFHATSTSAVKIGIQVLDSHKNVIKDYGNFSLLNSTYFQEPSYNHNFTPGNLNAQQMIKLDNLSSAGAIIRVYDVDNFNAKTSRTQYSDIDINLSVKNATAYDNKNKAYYAGIVTVGHPREHEWFNYNANTSDIGQTISIFNDQNSSCNYQGLLKMQAYKDGTFKNRKQNPSADDWTSKRFGNAAKGFGSLVNVLTYQTPYSFTILRTKDVQYNQGTLNYQLYVYSFGWVKSIIENSDYYLDQAQGSSSHDVHANDELHSVAQIVDMTTLAGATKTVNFFNGRVFFALGYKNKTTVFMQIKDEITTTAKVEFNSK